MATMTLMVWNITTNNQSQLLGTQRENGGHHAFLDLPSLLFSASCHFPQTHESPLESRICSESPSKSAQEPPNTVDVALVTALVYSTFPATNSFPAISLSVLGSSKRAGILGGRHVPLVEKHGKLPGLGREALPPVPQSEQRHILLSLPILWQVFQERNHPPVAIAHFAFTRSTDHFCTLSNVTLVVTITVTMTAIATAMFTSR